ncbi:5' nucleotidase, deoxy (Pyrimidine), cytosolic type C protein (NT5C) [compost metagenome]
MQSNIIELDVDGVVLDIHNYIGSYVGHLVPNFIGDEQISSWGMSELTAIHPELRGTIFKLFKDPRFMGSIPLFRDTIPSLRALYDLCSIKGLSICFNTNVDSQCVGVRNNTLDSIIKVTCMEANKVIQCNKDKVMLNSLVCVEDNAENLRKSSAPIKFLIRRGHNRTTTLKDIGKYEKGFIVPSMYHVVLKLTKIL